MSNILNYFIGNTKSKYKDYSLFLCPTCGEENNITSSVCLKCGADLESHKSTYYSKYLIFNNVVDLIDKNEYFEALIELTKYLSFYPEDIEGQELNIYLLVKNSQISLAKKSLLSFEETFKRAPWLLTVPEDISQLEMPIINKKLNIEKYYNDKITFESIINQSIQNHLSKVNLLSEISNEIFNLYYANKLSPQNTYQRFNSFFELKYKPLLSNNEMTISDFSGKNYDELTDYDKNNNISVIGNVETKGKFKDGTIICYVPGIKYHSISLSEQKIGIVLNKISGKTNKNKKKDHKK